MTFVVVIFVVSVTVGASALWWIHQDGLATEMAEAPQSVTVDVPAQRAAEPAAVPARPTAVVRAWGRAHGHAVSDRGPLPKALVAAYAEAHAD